MGELCILESRRRNPHLSGETLCLQCGAKGVAVAPVGVTWMECDECGTMKKVFKYMVARDGDEWVCDCGSNLFKVTPNGIYCPNCGAWQEGF